MNIKITLSSAPNLHYKAEKKLLKDAMQQLFSVKNEIYDAFCADTRSKKALAEKASPI